MLNFTKEDTPEDAVVDLDPEGPDIEVKPEEATELERHCLFGITEYPEKDAIEIFPIRPSLILYGELEVKILIEQLKKYLHE